MATIKETDLGKKILDALGFENHLVKEIHIHIVPNDVVRVETIEYMDGEQFDELKHVLKEYHLEKNPPYNCVCLDVAGQLNGTYPGQPIPWCQTCHGTGYATEDKES